jgi:hypothetical protein
MRATLCMVKLIESSRLKPMGQHGSSVKTLGFFTEKIARPIAFSLYYCGDVFCQLILQN